MISVGDAAVAHWLAANRAAIAADRDAAKRAAARKALDATLARMRARTPAAAAPDLRAAAARELATGRYDLVARAVAPRELSPWDRFWKWAADQWDRLWNATGGRVRLGSAGASAIGWILIAAAAGLIVWAVVRLLASLQVERDRRRGVSRALDLGRNAHALYLQACALADRGAYARAARVLFVAAVTALDLRGLMRDDASATVGELRRTLRGRDGTMVAPFDELAGPFVAAAYAERAVDAGEWQRARAGYLQLVRTHTP